METKRLNKSNIGEVVLQNKALIILIIMFIFSGIATNGLFFDGGNISNLLKQTAVATIIGFGFTLNLSCGNMDLSVGQMLSLVGIVYAYANLALPTWLSVVVALALGLFLGFLNGFISGIFNLNGFVFTLATAQVFKGAAYLLCDGKSVTGLSDAGKYIGQGLLFGFLPMPTVVMLILFVLTFVIMNKTGIGREILAVGGNRQAAKVCGINPMKTSVIAFTLTGLFAAIAAVVLTGRTAVGLPGAGDGMEMDAIAAVVIGGTPLSGGKANVLGTLFGVLIIGCINNVLNLTDVSNFWQWLVKGLIIIFALLLDMATEKISQRKG